MEVQEALRNLLRKSQPQGNLRLVMGNASDVDKNRKVCTVQPIGAGEAPLLEVRLKPLDNGTATGMVTYPKDGTFVTVLVTGDDYYLFSAEEFDGFEWISPDFSMSLKDGVLSFNNGELNGMVKHDSLKAELDKMKAQIQAMVTVFQSWTPIQEAGLKAQLMAQVIPLPQASFEDIQNPKIKQ